MFVIIAPTCWFGSPHDFWWLAPTALTATATACVAIMVRFANPSKEDHCQANSHFLYFEFSLTSALRKITTIPRESIDSHDSGSCYTNTTADPPLVEFDPVFPPPEDFNGFGEGDTNHICTMHNVDACNSILQPSPSSCLPLPDLRAFQPTRHSLTLLQPKP